MKRFWRNQLHEIRYEYIFNSVITYVAVISYRLTVFLVPLSKGLGVSNICLLVYHYTTYDCDILYRVILGPPLDLLPLYGYICIPFLTCDQNTYFLHYQ